jgi:alpha-glucoside transport system permease protein
MVRRSIASTTLILIVAFWVVPFAGLLLTSLRPTKHANETGFWRSLVTNEIGYSFKTQGKDGLKQVDDKWIISGNIIEERNDFDADLADKKGEPETFKINGKIVKFGPGAAKPDVASPGDTIDIRGGAFTLQENGDYDWVFNEEYTKSGKTIGVIVDHPPQFGLRNYITAFMGSRIPNALINSFIVTIPATLIPITLAAFAAYAFSWMRFPRRDAVLIVVLALLVVPLQLAFIPVLSMYADIAGWTGALKESLGWCEGGGCETSAKSFGGLWVAHTAFGLPLAIYLLRNYIAGLPRELLEAARIDGATHFQIFVRLILPLSVPALASFGIFQFLWVWNDLLVALILGPTNDLVLPIEIQKQIGTFKSEIERLNASAFISMIVPLIVFLAMQKYFVRGLLAGSVKGG